MIDLQDPWLQVFIQEYVEAKDLKTHGVLDIIGLARPVRMWESGLYGTDGFNDCVLDILHDSIRVMTHLFQVSEHEGERPLVSKVILVATFVLYEVGSSLIDCIVGEMHEEVV